MRGTCKVIYSRIIFHLYHISFGWVKKKLALQKAYIYWDYYYCVGFSLILIYHSDRLRYSIKYLKKKVVYDKLTL